MNYRKKIDKDLRYYGLDKKSKSGLKAVCAVDKNKPHEMPAESGIGILSLENPTPAETVKLTVVLDYAGSRAEKADKSYKGYKYEF